MFLCFQWILLRRRLASTHIFWQGLLTWTGYNPMNSPLVFTITEKAPTRRPRDCLKPMNRLQLYPSSFKKTDLYSIMYNWQFEGKPSCEASYCKILVINNPIKHNRGVQWQLGPGQASLRRLALPQLRRYKVHFRSVSRLQQQLSRWGAELCSPDWLLHNAWNVLTQSR